MYLQFEDLFVFFDLLPREFSELRIRVERAKQRLEVISDVSLVDVLSPVELLA